MENLKQYIDTFHWKEKRGVKALGIYRREGKFVFVTTTKAVIAGGESVDTIIQLEKHRHLQSRILDYPFITSDQLLIISTPLLSYNEPQKTVPILAWIAGCFLKPFLKRKPTDAKYAHLFLIGEQGSGKSNTMEKVIMPIFARKIKIKASSQTTPFTMLRESASSNVIPQTFNEYKPSTMEKSKINNLNNHMRDAYDGHESERGRADQGHNIYEMLAPFAIAGEENPQEAAIRERTIELLFSKHDLLNEDFREQFGVLQQHYELLPCFGRSLLDTALKLTPEIVNEWYREGERRYLPIDFPSRITSNLACIYAGLKLVQRLCSDFGHSWDYYFPIPFDECADYLSKAVREYLLGGSNYNKSIIEETFEVMSRMRLKYDVDYCFENAGRTLCLRLSDVYDKYTKYRKDYAIVGTVLTANEFRRQFGKSVFCIKANTTVRMKGEATKVWKVDFEALSQVCEVSGFLRRDDKQDAQAQV